MTKPADGSEIKKSITEAVREALAEKEEANRISKVEGLLGAAEDTVRELSEAMERKEGELASSTEERDQLLTQVEELKTKAEELEAKLSEATKSSDVLENRATAAEGELAKIAADRSLELRMTELEVAKVVKTGDKRDVQAERVRIMSDEEFAAYKDELVELRSAIEAELRETAAEATTSSATSEEGGEGDGTVIVAAADIERARLEEEAATAANTLNIETASEDLRAKFARFGETMAANLSKDPREQ